MFVHPLPKNGSIKTSISSSLPYILGRQCQKWQTYCFAHHTKVLTDLRYFTLTRSVLLPRLFPYFILKFPSFEGKYVKLSYTSLRSESFYLPELPVSPSKLACQSKTLSRHIWEQNQTMSPPIKLL